MESTIEVTMAVDMTVNIKFYPDNNLKEQSY